jgi:superfamily I DNA/RNA helicase
MNAISGDGISEEDLVKIADYILKYYSCFCNSAEDKIQNTNFKEYLIDQSHLRFYERFEEVIISVATQMFSEMWYGDIELDLDFILKRYERSKPVLDYGMIILDEAQDSSDAILSIFNRQKSIKVAVGDHHQSIYSWRYANNSMRKLDFKRFTLTGSYRFGAAIASVANGYLNWKNFFGMKCEFEVKGLNTNTEYDPCNIAFLSRKNSGLFDKAISMLDEVNANELKMLFEGDGGFNGYLFSESGISIYDVIQIGLGNLKRVRHPTAKMLKTLENVLEFGKSSNDVALKNFCELFDYYGEKLEEKINFIKRLEVKYDDKDKPDIIFSTVHRSKGREYNVVELCNDFLGFDKLLLEYNNPESTVNIEEEINLIYVAVTRAKYKVIIDDTKLPSISDDYKK